MLKELTAGDWTIDDLRNIFSCIRRHGGRTFGVYNLNPSIMTRYANRPVNAAYFGKVTVENRPIKYLTDEEFKAGKPGYILANFRTELRTPLI